MLVHVAQDVERVRVGALDPDAALYLDRKLLVRPGEVPPPPPADDLRERVLAHRLPRTAKAIAQVKGKQVLSRSAARLSGLLTCQF